MSLLDLDNASLLHVFSFLEIKEVGIVSTVCKTFRSVILHNSELFLHALLKDYGLHLRTSGRHSYPRSLLKALQSKLKDKELSQNEVSHVRFHGLYTDAGVDENMYHQFWCERAFQCNSWGAFCSQISPNVNVLGLLKSHSQTDQLVIQLRFVAAELCKWVAGKLLARVPLPAPGQLPTSRQARFYAKSAASLLRWNARALFRMYCILYKKRQHNDTLGQTLELGVALGEFQPGTRAHEALIAALGPMNTACTARVDPSDLVKPENSKKHGIKQQRFRGPYGPQFYGIDEPEHAQHKDNTQHAGNSAEDAHANGSAAAEGQQVMKAAQYCNVLLRAIYDAVLPFTELGPQWVEQSHGPVLPGAAPAAAPIPQIVPVQDAGGFFPGNAPRSEHMKADTESLHIYDEQQAQRLTDKEVANVSCVFDMLTISRAGNFTCPVRSGALLLGTVTDVTPAVEDWLRSAAAEGKVLHPYRKFQAVQQQNQPVIPALHLLHQFEEAVEKSEKINTEAIQKELETIKSETVRAYLNAISQQRTSKALNNLHNVDDVVKAVKRGELPSIVQHTMFLNGEAIEFQRRDPANSTSTTVNSTASEADQKLAAAAVQLQPVLWFRFYTRAEAKAVFDVYRFHAQGNSRNVTPASRAKQSEPWGTLPDGTLNQYRRKFTRHWNKKHGVDVPKKQKGKKGKKGHQQESESAPQEEQPRQPTDEELHPFVPQQIVCLGPDMRLEVVTADGAMIQPPGVSKHAWGCELLKSQQLMNAPGPGRRTRSRSREPEGQPDGMHVADHSDEDGSVMIDSDSDGFGSDSSLMDSDSSEFEAQLDDMQDDIGPLNVAPAEDVDDLLNMIGYGQDQQQGGPMDVDSEDEQMPHSDDNDSDDFSDASGGDHNGGGGDDDHEGGDGVQGVAQIDLNSGQRLVIDGDNVTIEGVAGASDRDYFSVDSDDSDGDGDGDGDGSDGSGTSSDGWSDFGGSDSDSHEDGAGWEEDFYGMFDEYEDDEDDPDPAEEFPDLVHDTPHTVGEHQLMIILSQAVGMEVLTQSHVELDRECHRIIDDSLQQRTIAKAKQQQLQKQGKTDDETGRGRSRGSKGEKQHGAQQGGKPGSSRQHQQAGASSAATAAALAGGGSRKGKKKGRKSRHGSGGDVGGGGPGGVGEPASLHVPLEPSEEVPIDFLPGDETALDSVAFQPIVSVNDMRSQVGLIQARLRQPRSGNMVCLKLITPEDRMEEMDDPHSDPNVDIQYVAFRGRAFALPPGMLQG